jgi:hypothetical protein
MKETRSSGWLWLVIIIFGIYHLNVTSNLEADVQRWKDDYDNVETQLIQVQDERDSIQSELEEFRACFEDENWTYCVNNYI